MHDQVVSTVGLVLLHRPANMHDNHMTKCSVTDAHCFTKLYTEVASIGLLCRKRRNGCGEKKNAPSSVSRRLLSQHSQLAWKKRTNRRKWAPPPTPNSSSLLSLPVLLLLAAAKTVKARILQRQKTHHSKASSSSNNSHRLSCRQLLCQLLS